MKMHKYYWLLFLITCIWSCKKDDHNRNESDFPKVSDEQTKVDGKLDLPQGIDPASMSIITPVGTYKVRDDNTFTAVNTRTEKQLLIAENEEGQILLASLPALSGDILDASSTAQAIVGMAPWTGFVGPDELITILDEMSTTNEYIAFEDEVAKALDSGSSPFTNSQVLDALQLLFSANTSLVARGDSSRSVKSLPEVFDTVEPTINYTNGSFIIRNDGTTTAVWGVEVFQQGQSITGKLMLQPNKVKFPTLGSIWNFVKGSYTDLFFENPEPLEVPVSYEDKYTFQFGSPTEFSLNPDLSFEAARCNFYNSYKNIFDAFGIDIKTLKASEYFDQGCVNKLFNSTTTTLVNIITTDRLNTSFYLDQVGALFSGSAQSLSACSDLFENFPGSTTSGLEKYLKKLSIFLDAYSKVEAAFVTGKLIGDMWVLHDIEVCRQIIDGKIYPCFQLEKNEELEGKSVASKTSIYLNVSTVLDIAAENANAYPIGVPVNWEILEGDGTLNQTITPVENDGVAEVKFTAGESESFSIRATIKTEDGDILDEVTYNLNLEEEPPFDFSGTWYLTYYSYDFNTGQEYLHSEEKITSDYWGNAVSEQVRYPTNDPPYNGWQPSDTPYKFSYQDNRIAIGGTYVSVVVDDVEASVFYSPNWNTVYEPDTHYFKYKLEK